MSIKHHNPPWSAKLSKIEKDNLVQAYPELAIPETFSVALNNGINALTAEGQLYFFLPYSLLNVATHKNIRKKFLALKSAISIIDGPNFIFPSESSSLDDEIIDKIYSLHYTTLKTGAVFTLAIVTGNNDKYIKKQHSQGLEPIFRGKDILAYSYAEPACYIGFKPTNYQQTAPIDYCRQKKIVCRFMSDRIIYALDQQSFLFLNSANLFIPSHYPMESVVCLFNNLVYTFLYRKKFYSRKIEKHS